MYSATGTYSTFHFSFPEGSGKRVPTSKKRVNDYAYGFQGQEEDDEIKGEGNSVNYTFRMHDPRLGRFFAIDPLAGQYHWNSPYAFSENSVIAFLELEGLETVTPFIQNFDSKLKFTGQTQGEDRKFPGLESNITKVEQWKHNENGTKELIKIIYRDAHGRKAEFSSYSEMRPSKIIRAFPKYDPTVFAFMANPEWGPGNPEWEKNAAGIATSCSIWDPVIGETQGAISDGLQGIGMSEGGANTAAGAITFIGAAVLARKVSSSGVKAPSSVVAMENATVAEGQMTTVGRWMSQAEYNVMKTSGQVLEGAGGKTSVATGGASSFMKQAAKGSVYVEFDVPTSSLIQGGQSDWFSIVSQNASKSMKMALEKQGGQASPPVQNLSPVIQTK